MSSHGQVSYLSLRELDHPTHCSDVHASGQPIKKFVNAMSWSIAFTSSTLL
jgi:hypothetical protein